MNGQSPAFPCDSRESREFAGLSLRDYFIAHAPAEPWPWFRPTIEERPQPGPWVDGNDPDGSRPYDTRYQAEKVYGDEAMARNQKAIDEWDERYRRERCKQWPIFWAECMLEQRS